MVETGIEIWLIKAGAVVADIITAITTPTWTNCAGYQSNPASVTHIPIWCDHMSYTHEHTMKRKVLPNHTIIKIPLRKVDHKVTFNKISLPNLLQTWTLATGVTAEHFSWQYSRALDYALTEWNKTGNTTMVRILNTDGVRTEWEDPDGSPSSGHVAAKYYDYNNGSAAYFRFAGTIDGYKETEDFNNNLTIDSIDMEWGGT